MYRVYDKPEAIRNVQRYLIVVGDPDIFVAPTGVYDENTRLSVIDFQTRYKIEPTGEVDYGTFTLLYDEYMLLAKDQETRNITDLFIQFPVLPRKTSNGMAHINLTLARVLDYYGFTHQLRDNNFQSDETAAAVEILRDMYFLDQKNYIDEEFYRRMILDHDSIAKVQNNSL